MNIGTLLTGLRDAAIKNSPTILTAIGATGTLVTAVLASKGTVTAIRLLDEEVENRRLELPEEEAKEYSLRDVPVQDIVEKTWQCYIPAIATGLVTIACVVGANHISLRRQAALVSLYSLAEKVAKEYEQKVVEVVGQKQADKIKEEIVQDKMDETPVSQTMVFHSGNGTTLFFDKMSGRYFYDDLERVRKIENDFNKDILSNGFKLLNEFYDELGLEHVKMGDMLGWGSDYGFLEIKYVPKIADNGQPCIALDYKVEPEHRW